MQLNGPCAETTFRPLQGVILLEERKNYETPSVASRLSADPFRDNGFYAVYRPCRNIRRFMPAVQSCHSYVVFR